MAHNYIVRVTAGPEYDTKTHKVVPVNSSTHVAIDSDLVSAELHVRIQNYRGLPRSSPSTSPYFALPPHSKNGDQYSIAFKFAPKHNINGNDLVFGNDFDHPIRDRLPPGFGTAFKIVKWAIDPGLDGDVYAEKPYLYGATGGSMNTLFVGGAKGGDSKAGQGKVEAHCDAGLLVEEGGDEDGLKVRREKGVPDSDAARKKWFLNEDNRKGWEWEAGREYGCDFFNPYLDFNDFALRLPGFTLPIMKYWDGQGLRKEQKRSHTLRYVLKNRATDKVLFVVLFTLYLKEDVDEAGNIREGAEEVNLPIEMRGQGERERHAKAAGKGSWWWRSTGGEDDDEEEEEEEEEEGVEEEKKKTKSSTDDDDVD